MEQNQNSESLNQIHSQFKQQNEEQTVIQKETEGMENSCQKYQNLPSLDSNQNRFQQLTNQKSLIFNPIKQVSKSSQNLKLQKSHKRLFNLSHGIKRTSNQKQSYTDWKFYQNKSDLNMIPFPYCVQQNYVLKKSPSSPHSLFNSLKNQFKQQSQDKKQKPAHFPRLYKLKIQNQIQVRPQRSKQNKIYRPIFNYEKTPVNEYLNYDLAEQINSGLRDVQIIADQNRRIKKAKKQDNQIIARQKSKLKKGIKVKRQYVKNNKGLYKNDH